MKRLLMSMFLGMVLLTPAMAKADVNISDSDISAIFNESTTSDGIVASALSLKEMEETEGAWVNFAIGAGYGALGGGISYYGGYAAKGYQWNNRDFAKSVAGGAIGGLIPGGRVVSTIAGGFVGGFVSNYKYSNWKRR